MAEVVLQSVTKRFGDFTAVDDISMEIEDGKFTVLVGPSGCGKTTTLRMVAGLEEITAGEIKIGERVVNRVPPKDRDIAMVFQNYALYPHMDVFNNMAFGLKLRKTPKKEIRQRVQDAAELLGIEEKLKSKPRELSGGQRQRVAVGRAIVRNPKVFLFDEPLSNLDAKLRVQMRTELEELHRKLRTTTIYVTHDQVEAMTLGDRIAVMKDGVIQQYASPQETYDHPANQFVAGFIGSPAMNFLEATLETRDGGLWVNADPLVLRVADAHVAKVQERAGQKVIFGVRPDDIYDRSLNPRVAISEGVVGTVTVDVTEPMGSTVFAYLAAGKHSLVAELDAETKAEDGEPLEVVFDMTKAHLFDPQTEVALT